MAAPPVFRSFEKSPDESMDVALDIAGPPRRSGERRGPDLSIAVAQVDLGILLLLSQVV